MSSTFMKYEISFRNPLDNSEAAALAIDPKITKIIIESQLDMKFHFKTQFIIQKLQLLQIDRSLFYPNIGSIILGKIIGRFKWYS